jgi:LysR family nitrogen assimilation transcriptional regulator
MVQARRLAEIDKRQAEYFVALYEEGNVTRAAAKLHIVQPALSMQIRRLEQEFEVKLFERTARGVEPTAVGRAFYQKCQQILADFQAARLYLADASANVAGDVVVGVMPTVAMVLPRMLPAFMEAYPRVRLSVVEGYSSDLAAALRDRKLDAAVMNRLDDPALSARGILHDELVLLTGVASSPIAGTAFRAQGLRRLKLVLPSRGQGIRVLLDKALADAGIRVEPSMEFDSVHGIVDMTKRSDWATILPYIAYVALDDGGLKAHRIEDPVIPREIVVAHQLRRPPSAATTAFVSAVESLLASLRRPEGEIPQTIRHRKGRRVAGRT